MYFVSNCVTSLSLSSLSQVPSFQLLPCSPTLRLSPFLYYCHTYVFTHIHIHRYRYVYVYQLQLSCMCCWLVQILCRTCAYKHIHLLCHMLDLMCKAESIDNNIHHLLKLCISSKNYLMLICKNKNQVISSCLEN